MAVVDPVEPIANLIKFESLMQSLAVPVSFIIFERNRANRIKHHAMFIKGNDRLERVDNHGLQAASPKHVLLHGYLKLARGFFDHAVVHHTRERYLVWVPRRLQASLQVPRLHGVPLLFLPRLPVQLQESLKKIHACS